MARLVLPLGALLLALGVAAFAFGLFDAPQGAAPLDAAPAVRRPGPAQRPAAPPPTRPPLPPGPANHDVVVVGEEGDPDVPGEFPWEATLTIQGLEAGRATGADVLEGLRKVVPVRFHRDEDLEALRRIAFPAVDLGGKPLRLQRLQEILLDAGVEAHPAGAALFVIEVHERPR